MIQVTDLLVTKTAQTFSTIEDWVDIHGKCGTHHPEMIEVKLILGDDGKSATRICVFDSLNEFINFEQERQALRRLKGLSDDDRAYTVTRIQLQEEITL